jgi:hypothetical protein
MTSEQALRSLERGYAGRLATVSEDGYPYCVPLLYIWADNQVFLHGTSARGHLRTNIEREPRACFEIDEPDDVITRIAVGNKPRARSRSPSVNDARKHFRLHLLDHLAIFSAALLDQLIRRHDANRAVGNQAAPDPMVVPHHGGRIQVRTITYRVTVANDNDVVIVRNSRSDSRVDTEVRRPASDDNAIRRNLLQCFLQ